MADKLDDAQGEDTSNLSYQDQMAAVKAKYGNDDSPSSDDDGADKGKQDDNDPGAEGDDSQSSDDSNNDDSQDDQGGDSGDDSGNDDASSSDDKSFEGRFNQFKGDGTSESYIKNLEDGYQNSSQEAIRLKTERDGFENQVNAIKQAAAADKELGARLLDLLNGSGGNGDSNNSGKSDDLANKASGDSDNPFLKDAETAWNKQSEAEAAAFAEKNPEVITDPKINAEVKRWMRIFSNEAYESEGRLMKAGEAMKKAYNHLGYEDKSETQGDLVNGMKQNAAPTRPQASKKKPSGSGGGGSKQFSDLTLSISQRMGISKERLEKGTKKK